MLCKIAETTGETEWCEDCRPEKLSVPIPSRTFSTSGCSYELGLCCSDENAKSFVFRRKCEMKRLIFKNYREGRFRPNFGASPVNVTVDINLHSIGPVLDTEMVTKINSFSFISRHTKCRFVTCSCTV